ncbi:MAG: CTP synthase, partial [Nitrospirae bacterium]|nr:CTP synthase [Nitrospirota bacterium]
KERKGEYLGGTVQVIPHITDEIKRCIRDVSNSVDVAIVEVGGTVGDIESLPFLEALRQLRFDMGRDNTLYIHLTLVPHVRAADEIKTKPTQHSVNKLREIGIQPDILMCRTEQMLPVEVKKKIALFCNVESTSVITAKDVETIYEVPLVLHEEGLDTLIVNALHLQTQGPDLLSWEKIVRTIKNPKQRVTIGVVGKYIHLKDSYKSLCEALTHGGVANEAGVQIHWVDAEDVEKQGPETHLGQVDGILVPGGFGNRGIEGKIAAIQYARERGIPFFGICLGMQCAVIEFSRNVSHLQGANSSEFDPKTSHPVIHLMPGQEGVDKGGSMRLGSYPCVISPGSLARKAYRSGEVKERHRHRYELNNVYRETLLKAGLGISGVFTEKNLVEIIEWPEHPWFLATQFHPEFQSRPRDPHPLFVSFIEAAIQYQEKNLQTTSFQRR